MNCCNFEYLGDGWAPPESGDRLGPQFRNAIGWTLDLADRYQARERSRHEYVSAGRCMETATRSQTCESPWFSCARENATFVTNTDWGL